MARDQISSPQVNHPPEAAVIEGSAMTSDGMQTLEQEVERLETKARREIAERIKTAREWGDLKENAEYHDAKNEQALLETKILRMRQKLNAAVVVEPVSQSEVVGFGSTVRVVDEASGSEATYKLVGSTEASLSEGRLSADSPVARALQGRRVGETARVRTPRGERRLKVVDVAA
ncbi:MAG TPA: transcription elongation factor GreA [Solirubrobacteraceae bacterium]|nr:transcription elongation factor GreA [Solirubrobacteraceae bacterium]